METLQRTANRGSLSTGYDIDNSLKFEPDNSEILKRTYGSGGTVQKWTFSTWIKRTELVGCRLFGLKTNGNVFLQLASDKLRWYVNGNDQNTEAVYRDTSAWYHIILQFDSAQSTASNRTKIYVNGVQQTLTGSYVNQNTSAIINSAVIHGLGGREDNNTEIFAGYMAETYFIDNQALEPSDFGEYDEDSGIWKPKEYEGTFGTTGWYLDFKDAANLGDDVSGNNNDWTETNITAADQATDTPTNNFATWNVLDITRTNTQGVDMVEGAMSIKHRGSNGWTGTCSTIAISKGKWYWEAEVRVTNGASMWGAYPVATRQANVFFNSYIGGPEGAGYDTGAAFYDNDDAYYHDNTATACTISGSTFNTVTGDVIMIAVDMDNNKLYAGVNGNWCNSSDNTLPNATGITLSDEPHYLAAATYTANTTNSYNFGGFTTDTISSAASDANGYGTFEYAPPSGYYALCTKNLAEYG